ncbi:hypothetical protein TSAR_007000 [Trichomalopsis sarcophagae]|uniref:Uncharacterized protein n=1 Tax=Trichomalopsis sarcophagae TaxID=543379 RepID=A0A232EGV8_9HYME|nr:hypothetical protein TSAR_007000 [Trichomalopsis sarcophagae]
MSVSTFLILFLIMASNIAGQDLPHVSSTPSQSSVATKTPTASRELQTEKEQIIRREDSNTDSLSDGDFITVEDLNDIDAHEVEPYTFDQTTKEETPTLEGEYNENNAKKEEHYSSTPDENMSTKTPEVTMRLITTDWLTLPVVYLYYYRTDTEMFTIDNHMHYYYDSSSDILEEEEEESLEADQEESVDQHIRLYNPNATVVENLMETSLYIMHVTMDVLFKMLYNLMESMMSSGYTEVDRTKFNRTVKDSLVTRI